MFATFSQLGTALTKNAKVAFSKGYKLVPNEARQLFSVNYVTDKHSEHDTSEYDPVAEDTGEGQDYASSDPVKGYPLLMTQGKITQSFELTKEIKMYDKYNVVTALTRTSGLGSACAKRIEGDLQLLIGMGTGTEYTNRSGNLVPTLSADGKPIFANNHDVRSGATFDNLEAIAFGQTGLEAHELLWRNFINHEGQQVDMMPDIIYSTKKPQLCNLIEEYMNSRGHVEDGFRGLNTYGYKGSKYRHLPMQYLDATNMLAVDSTKDDYWGLAMANSPENMLEVSQNPVVYPPELLVRNRNALVQTDAHYAYGIRNAYTMTLSNG